MMYLAAGRARAYLHLVNLSKQTKQRGSLRAPFVRGSRRLPSAFGGVKFKRH